MNRSKQPHTPDRTPAVHPLARAIALSLALGGGLAHAATITVDSSADGAPGTSPGVCTLRAAIESANTDSAVDACTSGGAGLDEIEFDPSLAESTITLAEGQLEITDDLSITGPVAEDAGGIVIDGDAQSRLLFIEGATASEFAVDLTGMTLTNGHTTNDNETGGGIHAIRADLTLNHTSVSGNSTEGSDSYGGGVYARYGNVDVINSSISGNSLEPESTAAQGAGIWVMNGDLALTDSTISENTMAPGGGIYSTGVGVFMVDGQITLTGTTVSGNASISDVFTRGGGLYAEGDLVMTDSTISGNSLALGITAGMEMRATGSAIISDSVFSGNVTDIDNNDFGGGGGLSLSGPNIELTNVEITDNSMADGIGYGGGVGFASADNAILTNVTIAGNTSAGRGGGVFIDGSSVTFINSTISNNTTSEFADSSRPQVGGGLSARFSSQVSLIGSTVSGNSAASYGGGIHGLGGTQGSSFELRNSTVSGNSSGASGGGIQAAQLSLVHSTVANNTADSGADGIHGSQLFFDNSLIVQAEVGQTACNTQATSHTNTLATDNSCTGTSTNLADIDLQPLADNGGPTLTHALGTDSVAIDAAGDCGADFSIDLDQRGIPRPGPGSSACDIGAFEFFIDGVFADRFEN
ncbi:choice-of-anchor Q domain-containing protein [Wenzhouxiangella sp. EGI_FJ10409]|uniref:choice-of-anchor Q domain-containing protein n=1 Tax=Wenzhouxiangella sp. EGI_FJ10409 TaxID=3243767 RepID=UPI0035E0E22E